MKRTFFARFALMIDLFEADYQGIKKNLSSLFNLHLLFLTFAVLSRDPIVTGKQIGRAHV